MNTDALDPVDSPNPVPCCTPLFAPTLDEDDAVVLANLLKAVADPIRLRLLNLISGQPDGVCACDLTDELNRSQPTISHHLKILTDAGLLDRDKRGKWAWFSVRNDRLALLCDALTPRGPAAQTGSPKAMAAPSAAS